MLDLDSLEKVVKISNSGRKRLYYELNCGCCNKPISRPSEKLKTSTLHFCQDCNRLKTSYCKRQYTQDPIFFLREKPEVYYSAGFIAADGNVDKNQSMIQIKIHQSDKIVLEKILEYSNGDNPIHIYDEGSDTELCSLRLNNFFWAKDLKDKFNITPNKTLTLEPPNFDLDKVSPELVKSFITGYIDGDGYVGRRKKFNTLELYILGTKPMMEWFGKCFTYYYGIEIPPKAINQPAAETTKVWRIVLVGGKAQTILTDLKQLPIYKLERKWSKV
jgi:hypothetical protein